MQRNLPGFAVGLLAGAALVAGAPLAAFDPPATAHGTSHGVADEHHGSSDAHHEAPSPDPGFRGCAYFEHVDYAGRRGDARDGASVEWIGDAWNDRISSAACAPGCRLLAYEHINFGGARRVLTGGTANVGPAWNDRISALRAVCRAEPPHRAH